MCWRYFGFLRILHPCLVRLMRHWKVVWRKSKFLSVEFSVTKKCRKWSIRLREERPWLNLDLLHIDRTDIIVKVQQFMIAQLLEIVSRAREIHSSGGVSMGVIKIPHKCPSIKFDVRYPLDHRNLNLEKVLRKPSYSVMGRTDMFALLKSLLARLLETFDFKWMQCSSLKAEIMSEFCHFE